MNHFITINDLTDEEVMQVLEQTNDYRHHTGNYMIDKQLFAANLFFEPSTRTKSSFFVAERRLGIETLDFDTDSSSVKKGESLYDTAKTFEAIGANILIIRHESDEWANMLAENVSIPIVNAGAGTKDHPTQSLLDAYTIYQEFGEVKDLKVTIVGDIKHSRVAHSSAELLKRLGANVRLCTPESLKDDSMTFPYISIDEAVKTSDAIMLLRMQHERHTKSAHSVANYHDQYGLTKEREKEMQDHAIILHPGPVNRGVEIDSNLVECNRSRIFKQMQNGVFIRMAVLTHLLTKWGIINEN